jgi:DNA-binding protein HU-beta
VNKEQLIGVIADKGGMTKADAGKALDAVMDAIVSGLKNGEKSQLVNFGTFSVGVRKASTGRNPRTGEPIAIPASKQVRFSAGKQLKDAVN